MNPVFCDYCGEPAQLVTGKKVYPHLPGLWPKQFWRCVPCMAWVGCHRGTERPLGRLANADLRRAKMAAHDAFDRLWRAKMRRDGIPKSKARAAAYKWLANQLGIDAEECHVGMFDMETCKRVVEICQSIGRRAA